MPIAKHEDDERLLTAAYISSLKSVHAKTRWPVSRVAPELAYGISALAQGDKDAKKLVHCKALNEINGRLRSMRKDGKARIRLLGMPSLEQLHVITVCDASFAKEVGMKSQGGFFNLITSGAIMSGPAFVSNVEFSSNTINRVVRSTMAAESASLSTALDRQLFLRLLIESMIYGEPKSP